MKPAHILYGFGWQLVVAGLVLVYAYFQLFIGIAHGNAFRILHPIHCALDTHTMSFATVHHCAYRAPSIIIRSVGRWWWWWWWGKYGPEQNARLWGVILPPFVCPTSPMDLTPFAVLLDSALTMSHPRSANGFEFCGIHVLAYCVYVCKCKTVFCQKCMDTNWELIPHCIIAGSVHARDVFDAMMQNAQCTNETSIVYPDIVSLNASRVESGRVGVLVADVEFKRCARRLCIYNKLMASLSLILDFGIRKFSFLYCI